MDGFQRSYLSKTLERSSHGVSDSLPRVLRDIIPPPYNFTAFGPITGIKYPIQYTRCIALRDCNCSVCE